MLEICTIIAISFGYLGDSYVPVYTLDCNKQIYQAIELGNELIEVQVTDDKIEVKNAAM